MKNERCRLTGKISEQICHGCVAKPMHAKVIKVPMLPMAIQPPAIMIQRVMLTLKGPRSLGEGINCHNKA
jgi:hypothetical protein